MIRVQLKRFSVRAVHIGCWLLILPLVVAPVPYFFSFRHLQGTFTDGNDLTDPISLILSYLTPLAVVGFIGLATLWRFGLATKFSLVLAALMCLLFTIAPLGFGVWLWHRWNILWDLSYFAWWLDPIFLLWSSAYAACLLTLRGYFVKKSCRVVPLVLPTFIALLLGGVLAWNSLINDFSFSPVNMFAVTPFVVGFMSLMMLVFTWTAKFRTRDQHLLIKSHATLYDERNIT